MPSPKHFTVTFEYEDLSTGVLELDLLIVRGIRKGTQRPVYATITCNKNENGYAITPNTVECIRDVDYALKADSTSFGRLQLKPYWFHKLVHNYKG